MEMPDVPLTASFADALRGVDIVVFAAAHRAYTALSADALLHYTGRPVAIVDAQNAIVDATAEALRARGCRISGVGKGHWRKSGLHLEAQT
jgi:UDP-N-acetyl-D-mannosaminuronate dehydrogenase